MSVDNESWEKITIVPLGNEQYALKSAYSERYLYIPREGAYQTVKSIYTIGALNVPFNIIPVENGKVVFKSAMWGNYLRANFGNNVRLDSQTSIDEWEKFTLIPV